MRVLVTWGSKRGGTEGIGQILGAALRGFGFEVITAAADAVTDVSRCDAVIIGGALYANRWPDSVLRFARRNLAELRKRPVWLFSSGPLDDSAERAELPAPTQVAILAERIGAKGHITFGGRLTADAKGFPASAMAKTKSGDYRNPERIRAWAAELAAVLPSAVPGQAIEHSARSLPRLLAHGLIGWTSWAAFTAVLLLLPSLTAALLLRALFAPLIFTLIAWHYFRGRGSREPLPTALTFTGIVALFDFMAAAIMAPRDVEMWKSILGAWLPFALIFGATWVTGFLMSTMPWPKQPNPAQSPPLAASSV